MNKLVKNILIILGVLGALEVLSFLGFLFPLLNQLMFLTLLAATIVIAAYSLENGLLIVLTELIVGSKGYLFYLSYSDGKMLSLRLALWSALMLVFIIKLTIQFIKEGNKAEYLIRLKKFIFWKPFLVLAVFVFSGLISGLIYRNGLSNIFLDFNAWLYFLILLPAAALDLKIEKLKVVFLAGASLVALKTLILLGLFSNGLNFAPTLYAWLRKTLVGEMTTASGWNRVFIQSQIFPIIAYYFFLFKTVTIGSLAEMFKRKKWLVLILSALFFATLLISLSRSFWFGFAAVIMTTLIVIWRRYSFKRAFFIGIWFLSTAVLGMVMIVVATPKLIGNLDNQLAGRLGNSEEAAVVSRWSLLPELFKEIKKNPISGQGYGASLTYISSDPRVLQNNPGGHYTTYAFEWGYLDIWLKIGIFGLGAYLWLLFVLVKAALVKAKKNPNDLYFGLAGALVFLAALNIFTPYLNHPLGIGFIVLSSCLICKDRVY
ncbi:MAG: O-antigen ligase family protein [Candidatus Falkowbacteria bacterium]|nr:MAG: O-antigen ligase family protein [Candidatus Falkowbacteria bacterium]